MVLFLKGSCIMVFFYSTISHYQNIIPIVTEICNTAQVRCDGNINPVMKWNYTNTSHLYEGIWGSSIGSFTTSNYYVFTGHIRLNVYTHFTDSEWSSMTMQRPAFYNIRVS